MGSSKTILIVDDELDILGALGFFLSRKGIEVLTAENGLVALKIIQAAPKKPNVILLDLNMPVMNGQEFLNARKVSNIEPQIPVILLTSEHWEVNEFKVIGHIPKPFDLMNLTERIDFFLKKMTDDVLDVVNGKSKSLRI
jgi:DNA-binding response OmpR family regulator